MAAGEFTLEEDRSDAPIPTTSDIILDIVGIFERGLMDKAVECRGIDEVFAKMGGFTADNLETMGPLVQFFDEGGEVARCVRTCHHTTPNDPTTATCAVAELTLATASIAAGAGSILSTNAAPYNLEPGDTLVVTVDGGAPATATFSATAASRTGAATAPYTLTNGQTLTVSIDGGGVQTVSFLTAEFADIANATANEVRAVLAAKLVGAQVDLDGGAPRIRSDRRGTGSGVNVTGGTANGELGFATGNVAGTGNVSSIDAVSAAEVKTVVELAVAGCTVTNEGGFQRIASNTTGGASSILVGASSSADDEMGFDNATHTGSAAATPSTLRVYGKDPGTYAHEFRALPAAPSSGEAGRFNLTFERAGVVVRTYENASMNPADARYIEKLVNDEATGDVYLRVEDLDAATTDALAIPAFGTFGPLAGGNDGLVSLDDNDFIGGKSPAGGLVGFRCFDQSPGYHHFLVAPQRATPAVELAKLTYIETRLKGRCHTICEAPAGQTPDQMVTYFKSTAGLYRLSRKILCNYPRVKVRNPNRAVYGDVDLVTIPIGGLVPGIVARLAALGPAGIFDHPAGTDAIYRSRTVQDLETMAVNEEENRTRLQDANINPIVSTNGIFIDGAGTANDLSSWSTVGQSLGMTQLARLLAENLIFMRHRRINDDLLDRGGNQADRFMETFMEAGAFSSRVKSQAYFVDAGKGLNTKATKKARQTFLRIGAATDESNEKTFLVFSPFEGAAEPAA